MITRFRLFLPPRRLLPQHIGHTSISSSGGRQICAYSQREPSGLVTVLGFIFDYHYLLLLPSLTIQTTSSRPLTSSLGSRLLCVAGRAILGCLPHKLSLFEDMGSGGADDRLGCRSVAQRKSCEMKHPMDSHYFGFEETRPPKNTLVLLA